MISISYLDYYTPKFLEKAECLLSAIERDENVQINRKIYMEYGGIDNITVEDTLSNYEMVDLLVKKYQEEGHDLSDIDYIICNGEDKILWEFECIPHEIANKYKMDKASIILLNQQCAITTSAIEIADALINSGKGEKVLILTLSRGDNIEQRVGSLTILGDGAAMMILEKEGMIKVIDTCSRSCKKETEALNLAGLKETQKVSHDVVEKLLSKNNIKLEDIKYVITQNINKMASKLDAKSIGVSNNKLYYNTSCGHLGDVDAIMNIKDFYDRRLTKPGEKYLLMTAGGIHSSSTYVSVLLENN